MQMRNRVLTLQELTSKFRNNYQRQMQAISVFFSSIIFVCFHHFCLVIVR
uniref:Uncharacterized protein n=1 Tax=Solanum lycopersicum TaxID=4081 RepID=A0A3Q7H4X2_SOLLC